MKCKIKAISSLAIAASLVPTFLPSTSYAIIKDSEESDVIEDSNNSNVNEETENTNNNLDSNEENPTDLLVYAIENGDLVTIKNLIYKDTNLINSINNLGFPMLHTAVLLGTPDVVKLLIDNGANLEIKDSEGQTALDVAKNNNYTEMEKVIASAEFFQAIKSNKLEKVSILLNEYKFLIDSVDNENNSPLHEAVKAGDSDVVNLLIANGANVCAKDENGQTPLHVMAKLNNLDTSIMWKMVGAAKDSMQTYVNSVDNDERTALHLSALNNNIKNVEFLIQYGANVNALDKYGKTPLYYAFESQGKFRNTELHLAVMKNDVNKVKYLIANGANLNNKNARGETPLHIAAAFDYGKLVWLLLSSGDSKGKGANPNIKDDEGKTPLHISAMRNNFEITDLLVAYGAEINTLDNYGAKPLDYALVSTIKKQSKVPTSIISSSFKASNTSFSRPRNSSTYTGLPNIGNSCYYNTAIQQLYNIKPLRDALINIYISRFKDNDQNANNKSFLYRLSKLFYTMDQLRGRDVIDRDFMNEVIGMLVDRDLGDSIDIAFQTIFDLLNESGFNCIDNFRIIGAHNIFSAFSEERLHQIMPKSNVIDVSQVLNFTFSGEFEADNPKSKQANNLLINLNYFKGEMEYLNLPQVYENSLGERFELQSLSVNLGNHFVSWLRDPDGNWIRISDSFVSPGTYDFNDMLARAQREGNIATLIYTKI